MGHIVSCGTRDSPVGELGRTDGAGCFTDDTCMQPGYWDAIHKFINEEVVTRH